MGRSLGFLVVSSVRFFVCRKDSQMSVAECFGAFGRVEWQFE